MIGENILKLRKSRKMTQEEMANVFGVSRQSIQKWEAGVMTPEVSKLVEISKYFEVSLDYLICGRESHETEAQRHASEIVPAYNSQHLWDNYSCDLYTEYRQSLEEGRDVERLHDVSDAVQKLPNSKSKEKLADILFEMFSNAPMKKDFPYFEPSDYSTIYRCCAHSEPEAFRTDAALRDKVKGAWVGRVCGCLLGKPVECMRLEELIPMLKEVGNYPMRRYLCRSEMTEEVCSHYKFGLAYGCYPDLITDASPADDDTNYLVMACKMVEKYGRDFKSEDMAQMWLQSQSRNAYCTAERVAFRNFINGFLPPDSAVYKNPYREWIGAQIRGDYFGYINPGDPTAAAEMAYRDARLSHIKNGIYGEMFVAAMIAKAAVCDDLQQIIRAGLAEVPEKSRLAENILAVLAAFESGKTYTEMIRLVYDQFDDRISHDWCHTVANAMIVTIALLCGGGDYGKSICLAVQSGFDTDCNGATVGSIIGMRNGAASIPHEWTDPIHNRLTTTIFGVGTVDLDEMADLTMTMFETKE